jgi:uncharacterized protein YrrD
MTPRSGERRAADRRRSERRAICVDGIWRSSAEMLGFAVEASDGVVGTVADLCCEGESAGVTGLVVATRSLLPGRRRLLVPLGAIAAIDSDRRKIRVRSTRAEIRRSPAP